MHLGYIDEDIHPIDQCILYIHTVLPHLVQTPLAVILIAGLVFKCKKISFVSTVFMTVFMTVSVNIMYMVCYSPRMAVCDPLLVIYKCFTTTGIILSFYSLLGLCVEFVMLAVLTMRQARLTPS